MNVTTELSSLLLEWYARFARSLPWREQADPYAVWVSEIMLQQTRVETVIPYYQRWMARFPTVAALAAADQQEVLQFWEGLGYYSRARNLHRAARLIVETSDGLIPDSVEGLRRLPGIGRYTAGAIASIAFGKDEPALDGNVRRVLARVFDIALPVKSPQADRVFETILRTHIPPGQAGDFNQALMDLGASLCAPRSPECSACPLAGLCKANALAIQDQRPVIQPRPRLPHYSVTAAVIWRADQVLITQRPPEGLLGGLWEFPGGKQESGETLEACLRREIREELGVDIRLGAALGVFRHAYTHYKVTLYAFECGLLAGEPRPIQVADLRWVDRRALAGFPMGKIDRQIAARLASPD